MLSSEVGIHSHCLLLLLQPLISVVCRNDPFQEILETHIEFCFSCIKNQTTDSSDLMSRTQYYHFFVALYFESTKPIDDVIKYNKRYTLTSDTDTP